MFLEFQRIKRNTRGHTLERISSLDFLFLVLFRILFSFPDQRIPFDKIHIFNIFTLIFDFCRMLCWTVWKYGWKVNTMSLLSLHKAFTVMMHPLLCFFFVRLLPGCWDMCYDRIARIASFAFWLLQIFSKVELSLEVNYYDKGWGLHFQAWEKKKL